jgi:ferredoxin
MKYLRGVLDQDQEWLAKVQRFARGACWLIVFCWMLMASVSVFGVERFPPPDFDPGYQMPPTTAPVPRAPWLEYLDVLVLLGALSAAAWFVLVKRSRRPILGLTIFSALYFGFYRRGCVCSVGSIQDVTLALFNNAYTVPLAVLAFFLLPMIFALVCGRVFCSGVCPLGAIQDLFLIRAVKIPKWLEHGLSVIPYVYLGVAVLLAATGSVFIICQYDPFIAFYRRTGSAGMFGLGALFLIVGIFVGRPYCRFVCPYGALLGLLSRVSKWKVVLSPNDCLQCQICEVACPYGAIAEPGAEAKPKKGWGRFITLVLLPVWIAAGAYVGHLAAMPLSKLHPMVALAERVAAEDAGQFKEPIDASRAFRQTGRPTDELMADASSIRQKFVFGGWLLGGFVGLVFAAKFASPWFPSGRTVYEPDPGACVSCGRCYSYCPRVISQLKKAQCKCAVPEIKA